MTSIGGRDRAGVPELGGQGGPDPGRGVGRGVLAAPDGHVQPGRVVDDLVLADLQQLRERRLQPERVDRDRASDRPQTANSSASSTNSPRAPVVPAVENTR